MRRPAKNAARRLLGLAGLWAGWAGADARAQNAGLTFSADLYRAGVESGVTTVKGNVRVHVGNQEIEADAAEINSQTGRVKGTGNVRFKQNNVSIRAAEIDYDTRTGLGDFNRAVLVREGELYVEAKVLSRVGEFRYQARDTKVSTCQDCPHSWSVTGSYADVEIEEYVEIHHALFQVRDAPIVYFPVFIFPIKTKRQSGFLAPQLFSKHAELGYQFKVPYFRAMSPDADTTWTYRYATKGGHRLASQLRYAYSDRSYINGTASYGRNFSVPNVAQDRFGFSFGERFQLGPRFTQRFRGELSSDSRYTTHYADEFTGNLQPYLINEPSVAWQSDNYHAQFLTRFHRDNLIRDAVAPRAAGIDRLPEIGLAMPSRRLVGPVRWGFDSHYVAFRRDGQGFDPTTNWIVEGDRYTLNANLGLSSNVLAFLTWDPKVEMRLDTYRFPQVPAGVSPAAYRVRLLFEQSLSSQISRVYPVEGRDLKAVKHIVEPLVRWSWAPPDGKTTYHPFFANDNSPRFDLFDPGSPDAQQLTLGTVSEEQRLRPHHVLTLGLNTRVVGRYGEANRSYQEFFGANVEQDIDVRKDPLVMSFRDRLAPLNVSAFAAYGSLRLATNFFIFYNIRNRIDRRVDLTYTWSLFTLGLGHLYNPTDQNIGVSAAVKGYGPWSIAGATTYDLKVSKYTSYAFDFINTSSSQCWYFRLSFSRGVNEAKGSIDSELAPVFGGGFKSTVF